MLCMVIDPDFVQNIDYVRYPHGMKSWSKFGSRHRSSSSKHVSEGFFIKRGGDSMNKTNIIHAEGLVTESLPNGMF
jgi:hypothetical protein